MRGLEDLPLAFGLSRTIMVAGVCRGVCRRAHPFHALCRRQAAESGRQAEGESLGWLGGC